MLAIARPRQWLKNLLVVAAPAAAGALGHDDVPVRVALAFAAFCMLASGIYAINDVRDAPEDRRHPRKRRRPVAAGELSPRVALATGCGSIVAGICLCAAIRPLLAIVGIAYVTLTVSYTLVWRQIVVLDIFAIAGGFVLRAVAGGVAAPVTLSRWFLLVVTFGAIMVAASKRYAERTAPASTAPGPVRGRRRVLHVYSDRGLAAIIGVTAAGSLVAYAIWALELPAVNGIPWRLVTVVPFAAALVAYGRLVRRGAGEAPEELFLGDTWLRLIGLIWLLLFALGVDAAG
jgi:decaprenyl-phosphate phosphoribosyltransferase